MSIPLPALGIQPPQQPDLLGQVAKVRQIQAMGQEQQLRGQQIQTGELENQMRQRDMQDQQTTMQILGKHNGDLESALPELASSVSAKTFLGLQKSAVELKKTTAELDNKTLENKKLQSDQFLGLIGSVSQMDEATYRQNWPQIAARALEVEPELKGHVDPNQPIPQQMLQQYGMLFQTQSTALAKEAAQRAQKAQEETARHNQAVEKHDAAMEVPAVEKEFQDYYKSYLGAKKQQPSAASELAARQQYFKDKQPYGAQRIEIARENLNQREQSADRKDADFIDKNYVKPANDSEKSYQMFMEAYNNRNNAKTGAESMLALSTHLATTFGNVKGARVTKDMIQEHLGARGIGDKALVAVQKLTNGDVLSPDQWNAFKDLISNSRKLSWETAKKEADRRSVDIKGSLPADLSGVKPSTVAQPASDFFSQFGGKAR
jgi:hypothetical protein